MTSIPLPAFPTAPVPRQRTPFYDFHVQAGARLVEFAGWDMPIVYRSIIDEHEQTRKSGSIFDVSHMGRLAFAGPDATVFLDTVLTRNVAKQQVGQSRYSLVCNEAGGVLDDIIISRDQKSWIMVCNASNREKLWEHFQAVRAATGLNVDIVDNTHGTAMVAIQGPKVIDRLAELLPIELKEMKRYTFVTGDIMLTPFTVFRSGYTGEDGVEIVIPAKAGAMALKMLTGRMADPTSTIQPAGLGARDTLRLEAGMPLYGHELGEAIDPLSAGLGWAVDLSKNFIGAGALRKVAADGPRRKLVGLELEGRRIARQGTPIRLADRTVGEVTSGTFSPTLQNSIAMAYVDADLSAVGTELAVDLKGTLNPAKIVPMPFYRRS